MAINRLGRIGVLVVAAFQMATVCAAAPAPFEQLRARLVRKQSLLQRRIHSLARVSPRDQVSASQLDGSWKRFCGPAYGPGIDMVKNTSAVKSAIGGDFSKLIPFLARIVVHCNYTAGALFRAADVLDGLYWAHSVHETGQETFDALGVRQDFIDLYLAEDALMVNARAALITDGLPVAKGDDLAPLESRYDSSSMIRFWNFLHGKRTDRALEAFIRGFGIQKDSSVLLVDDMARFLGNDSDVALLKRFYAELEKMRADPRRLAEAHGGWKLLERLTGHDTERAIRVLGVMSSLRYWPYRDYARIKALRGELAASALGASVQAASAYFLINTLDEGASWADRDGSNLVYHFFYPQGTSFKNWKFYHFYSHAHVGCKLAKQGHALGDTLQASKTLSQAYELLNFDRERSLFRIIGVDSDRRPILEGGDDIAINVAGARFGYEACRGKK